MGTCYSHTNKPMDKVKPERKFSNFANALPSPLLFYEFVLTLRLEANCHFLVDNSQRERERGSSKLHSSFE